MARLLDSASPVFDFPAKIKAAKHILIKPNVGYTAKPPAIVRIELLRTVVDQLLALQPDSRISIVEGVCTKTPAEDVFRIAGLTQLRSERVEVLDAEQLPMREYANALPANRFASFTAPALLQAVDVRISMAPFKRTVLNGKPLISATIKNLYGLLPRERYHARSKHARGQLHLPNVHTVICEVYGALGMLFDYGIADLHEAYISDDWKPDKGRAMRVGKVTCGEDLHDVDCAACEAAGEPECDYLQRLRTKKESDCSEQSDS
jgi:uncharacterized protein (DUF362 family)